MRTGAPCAVTDSGLGESSIKNPQDPVIEGPLAGELEAHKGRWVAVYQDKIVAVGDSAVEVKEASRSKNITDPLVFRVPTHANRIAFL
jgi:hypothetical protein